MRLWIALVPLVWLGCARIPDLHPPEQRPAAPASWELDPPLAEMGAADAAEYIVRDVGAGEKGGAWRWTFERPELRFILNSTRGQRFQADFGVIAATLAQTGPITVSFEVNGRLLGRIRCATPGDRHFEQPVPAEWLSTREYTRVAIQVDPLFVAENGVKLGVPLHRAGFVE
jgi:hypothetical protein